MKKIFLTLNLGVYGVPLQMILSNGLVESRKGLGLFVIQPKQILSDQERRQRPEKAVDVVTGPITKIKPIPQIKNVKISCHLSFKSRIFTSFYIYLVQYY